MCIKFDHVTYKYSMETKPALDEVSFHIDQGSFVCLIGHTGSGKSTLLQHFNGLKIPTSGQVTLLGSMLGHGRRKNTKEIKAIRQKIGLVFQFPEYQLFEETVLKDVVFGPQNFGISTVEAEVRGKQALRLVGMDEALFDRSPLQLSGGQMRRVAIAGILAMEPEVLVLDEPTAGLDPKGQQEILKLLKDLQQQGTTVVMATHNMDVVAQFADQVLVLKAGELIGNGSPEDIFGDAAMLEKAGVSLPTVARVFKEAFPDRKELPLTLDDFLDGVKRYNDE